MNADWLLAHTYRLADVQRVTAGAREKSWEATRWRDRERPADRGGRWQDMCIVGGCSSGRRNGVLMTSLGGGSSLLTGIAQSLSFSSDGAVRSRAAEVCRPPCFRRAGRAFFQLFQRKPPTAAPADSALRLGTSLEAAGDVRPSPFTSRKTTRHGQSRIGPLPQLWSDRTLSNPSQTMAASTYHLCLLQSSLL